MGQQRRATCESLEARELLTQYFEFGKAFTTNLNSASSRAAVNAIATDTNGNVYVTGDFAGSIVDFDPTFPGENQIASAGGTDIFISKFDSTGNLIWNVTLGGTGDDIGLGIAVNTSSQVFIVGSFSGTVDFNASAATQNRTSAGGKDIFVLVLNANSGAFSDLSAIGGTGEDQATSVSTFLGTEVLVTGFFNGTVDFNDTATTNNLVSAGGDDIFLLDLTNNLDFSNAFRMGGTGQDRGASAEYTANGDYLMTGTFSGTGNFNPRAAAVNLTSAGATDGFVARYDTAMFLKWAQRMGGTGNDTTADVHEDVNGRIVAVGSVESTVDFDPTANTLSVVSRGGKDGFLETFDAFGAFERVQQVGGLREDVVRGIDIDSKGTRFVVGDFEDEVRFGLGNGAFPKKSTGAGDMFLARLTPNDQFESVLHFPGQNDAIAAGAALAGDSRISLGFGFISNMDFNPGLNSNNVNSFTQGAGLIQLTADLKVNDANSLLSIRRNGDQIEVMVLDATGAETGLKETGLLSATNSVQINRVGTTQAELTEVNFAKGGSFTLPGGIQVIGPADANSFEVVRVTGIGNEAFTVKPSKTTAGAGTVLAHNQTITLTNVDVVNATGAQSLFIEPQGNGSTLTVQTADVLVAGDGTQVQGTTGGVAMFPVGFVKIPSVTLSTELPLQTPATAADTITVQNGALSADGLKNLYVRTGRGDDNLVVNGADISLPVAGGAFWYLAGSGTDRISAVADTNYDLNDARLVSAGGGRIQIDDVERASLTGGAAINHLNASLFTGDATLDGAAGNDLLRGGFGNDTLFGGIGNDRLYGNDGDDVLNGQDNNDQLFGGNGDDNLQGAAGNDRMFGDDGDDFMNGGAANDDLFGGNGNDNLQGGTQEDRLFGEAGDDILNGNEGNDLLDGGLGNDTSDGGLGVDLHVLYGTNAAEDLQLARLSATSATFKRKPRGLTSALETDAITMDATDEFFIQALDGDDLIAVDAAITQLGSVDGGNGTDSCTAPAAWTKVSC